MKLMLIMKKRMIVTMTILITLMTMMQANDDDDSNNNNEATRMTVAAIQQNDARLLLCNFSTCINLFGLKHVVLSHPQPTHKNISLTSVLHRQYQ